VRLIVQNGKAKGQAVEIQTPRFVIGRDPRCHLKPNSPTISRIHAIIEQRDGRIFLRDHGTVNGTRINDRLIQGQEVEVADGDRLELGPLVFSFSIQSLTAAESPGRLEDSAAQWLVEGGEADSEGSTILFNAIPQPAAPPPRSKPEPKSEPAPVADAAEVRVHHVRFEVVRGVLVVTILTPDLNDEPSFHPIRFELLTLFEKPLPRRVVISLEHVTYLSSRAVGVLLAHYQRLDKAGGALRICHVSPNVTAILNQMRLPIIVEVFPSVDEAVLAPWE